MSVLRNRLKQEASDATEWIAQAITGAEIACVRHAHDGLDDIPWRKVLAKRSDACLLPEKRLVQARLELAINVLQRSVVVVKILKGPDHLTKQTCLSHVRHTRLIDEDRSVDDGGFVLPRGEQLVNPGTAHASIVIEGRFIPFRGD